jgi:tuftelin-interacting protein 11
MDDNFDLTYKNMYYAHEIYTDLKELLNEKTYDSSFKSGLKISSYDRIIWETWMPTFRRLMSNQSIKKCSHKCTDLLNAWQNLLPPWILKNILDQIILPKLISETEEWNPTQDTVPIHVWIHPWLPFMKDRLDVDVFPTIRFKLSNALSNWHPSDKSAQAILKPWKPPVFSVGSWDAFVCKNILPKLQIILADGEKFLIEPTDQNLEAWYWVIDWQELLPFNSFVALIENFFFPKWLQVLSVWLNSSPNYEEVSKWYSGWKNLIPDKLLQHPNIKAKLSHGLIMMNRSVSGAQVSVNDTYPASSVPQQEQTLKPTSAGVQLTSNPSISSFKDIIQKKAADNNILFMPVLNRFKEGKQVYRFGNLNIYIDRNVVFMLENGNFRPASVKEILEKSL